VVGLRDCALIRLHEKGSKEHCMPCHDLENAQAMAAHESRPPPPSSTIRTDDQITLDEVEKIGI